MARKNIPDKIYPFIALGIVIIVAFVALTTFSTSSQTSLTGNAPLKVTEKTEGIKLTGTNMLYRCFIWNRDWMDTLSRKCEGARPQHYDGPLGLLLTAKHPETVPLYRCYVDNAWHQTRVNRCNHAKNDGLLGYISTSKKESTVPLYSCVVKSGFTKQPNAYLTSLHQNCEKLGKGTLLGYISTEKPLCGNQRIEAGETCDDGNFAAGDGCGPTCLTEICGNGYLDPNEECDDGNLQGFDWCDSKCFKEQCIDSDNGVNAATFGVTVVTSRDFKVTAPSPIQGGPTFRQFFDWCEMLQPLLYEFSCNQLGTLDQEGKPARIYARRPITCLQTATTQGICQNGACI